MADKNETVSKSIRFPTDLWAWCRKFAKENGGRSAASVVREAVKEKQAKEKEKQDG